MSATADSGHAEHHPDLAHHFVSMAQQNAAAKLGMWAFLVQELLFFGGLFMAYIAMRFFYPETFHQAYQHLSIPWGATNTILLLTSSLTMALAVRGAQDRRPGGPLAEPALHDRVRLRLPRDQVRGVQPQDPRGTAARKVVLGLGALGGGRR